MGRLEPFDALVTFWRFPLERTITEYLRYKIFSPDKAEGITRMSGIDRNVSQNKIDLRARLTLPDGTAREFGPVDRTCRTAATATNGGAVSQPPKFGRPKVLRRFGNRRSRRND